MFCCRYSGIFSFSAEDGAKLLVLKGDVYE